jgi:hypothetical protein
LWARDLADQRSHAAAEARHTRYHFSGQPDFRVSIGRNHRPIVASISAWPLILTIPSLVLAREAHPAGIAFVTIIGLAGAVYSPLIVGAIKDLTGSFNGGLAAVGILLATGVGLMLLVPGSLMAPHGDGAPATQPVP